MKSILVTWVGQTDLRAVSESERIGLGPITGALISRSFDEAYLLYDYPEKDTRNFVRWASSQTTTKIQILKKKLRTPTHFGDIHEAATSACVNILERNVDASLCFHLSPGTPAMAAVWVILGKTRFPAELIESSREHGVRTASVPFDISAEFIPDLLRGPDIRLQKLSEGLPPETAEFKNIVHRSEVMDRVIARARRASVRNIPVLIQGPSGSGKELLARAVHSGSLRKGGPIVPVNCGAIPTELIESELFGHEKGAFTGAIDRRIGFFEQADGGTLFLDEVGELPKQAQVKMLRVLQEGEVYRLGSSKPITVDVRIVAATNRDLLHEVAENHFREDLFHRLAGAILSLPPITERDGDLGLLVDHLLSQVNEECKDDPGFAPKKLSTGARNLLLNHAWPGNTRELLNTLRRTALWSLDDSITEEDVNDALLPVVQSGIKNPLEYSLGGEFDLKKLVDDISKHYLLEAWTKSGQRKKLAASLVGFEHYQRFDSWAKRLRVY